MSRRKFTRGPISRSSPPLELADCAVAGNCSDPASPVEPPTRQIRCNKNRKWPCNPPVIWQHLHSLPLPAKATLATATLAWTVWIPPLRSRRKPAQAGYRAHIGTYHNETAVRSICWSSSIISCSIMYFSMSRRNSAATQYIMIWHRRHCPNITRVRYAPYYGSKKWAVAPALPPKKTRLTRDAMNLPRAVISD